MAGRSCTGPARCSSPSAASCCCSCVYELVWTNVTARTPRGRRTPSPGAELRRTLERPVGASPGRQPGPASRPSTSITTRPGHAFAVMYIPALGAHWAKAVVEGVDAVRPQGHDRALPADGDAGPDRQLRGGRPPGHERAAAGGRPGRRRGQPGRTSGRPPLGTPTGSQSTRSSRPTRSGPAAGAGQARAKPTKALLTMTTCNPRWASYERWIVSGVLIDTRAETKGPPPGLDVKG